MSIEYDLEISSKLSAADMLAMLSKFDRVMNNGDHLTGPALDGIWVLPESERGKALIHNAIGIKPELTVNFVINKQDWQTGTHMMLFLIMEILRQTQSDGTVLFNGESPILIRKGGKLILNNDFGFWTPDNLAYVTTPYDITNAKIRL